MNKKISTLFIFLALALCFLRQTFASAERGNFIEILEGYIKTGVPNPVRPQAVSFEFYVNPSITKGIQYILSVGNISRNSSNYEIGINGSSVFLNYKYGQYSSRYITAGYVEKNVWNHLGITIDKDKNYIFVNGIKVLALNGAEGLSEIGPDIIIGRKLSTSTADSFSGGLDELRISAATVSVEQQWNAKVYENSLTPDSDTVLLWNFNQPRGDLSVKDASVNKINGSLVGGDMKIRFYGTMPTPTKYILPTLPAIGRITIYPRITPNVTQPAEYTPTPSFPYDIRSDRPVFSR